jgi:hypothetical protein
MHTYDFNYSTHFEAMPKEPQPTNDQERLLIKTAREFVAGGVVREKDMQEFVKLLVRQTIFARLSGLLMEIGEIEFELLGRRMEKADRLDVLRDQLCTCLQEVNLVLGRQRDYYINLILLTLTLILTRLLSEKHSKAIEKGVLFHLLNW